MRGHDIACRHGGEEFALILGGMDAEAAASRVNAIREACHALVVDNHVGGRVSTSFSAGVATFPADATTSSELLRTADLALYRAKSEGRDRVVVGVSSAVPSP